MRAPRGVLLALGGALVLACAKPAPRPVRVPLPESVRPFLVSPLAGVRPVGAGGQDAAVAKAFERLLAGDLDLAERQAAALAAATDELAVVALAAQIDLVRGRLAEVVAELGPLAERVPAYPAVQLTLARALELNGDPAEAFVTYQRVSTMSPIASERAAALATPAAGEVSERLARALASGQDVDVDRWLGWLERWLPRERATVEARRQVSLHRGDLAGELKAVRRLAAEAPNDRALVWRLGELELAAGDPGRGLEIFEGLAARHPDDAEVAEGLARARFTWRLATLPSQVQIAVKKEQLTRADLATMVYWLVPGVRAGRPAAGTIASDVLDHPRREEIVRVVNFGIMRVDDSLHLFEPGRPASRVEVNATLARLLALFGKSASCARPAGIGGEGGGREAVCALLARCRVSPDPASCLAPGAPSGSEVLDGLRRTLEAMNGGGR